MSAERRAAEPWQWGVVEAAAAVREGRITPSDLLDSVLERIDAVEPQINAFAVLDRPFAERQAEQLTREAARGAFRGPLHGVPVAIKDIFDIEGQPTRCGSELYRDAAPAAADSAAVARLRAAGGLLVGKTTSHELACGVYTEPTRNPWDLSCCCGGSSGGSGAAVAAGAAMAATGSDTGGSIRIPAAVCGLVGVKPTYDLLSRAGVAALSWSLDHVGPLARSVDDAALVLQAMIDPARPAAGDHRDVWPVPPAALSTSVLGVPDDEVLARVTPPVREAFDEACAVLEAAGARIIHVSIPELHDTLTIEFAIVMAEAASYHAAAIRERPAMIEEGIRRLFLAGALLPTEDYLLAQRLRAALCRGVWRVFAQQGLDALITPTLPMAAYPPTQAELEIDGVSESITEAAVRTTAPFNLTGAPVVSLPMGMTPERLPLSVQFVGRPYDERGVLGLAKAYEQRRDSRLFDEAHPIRRGRLA